MHRTVNNSHNLKAVTTRLGAIAVCLTLVSLATAANALDPNTTDPSAILRAASAAQVPARSLSRVKMTIRDNSGNRERVFSMRSKRYPDAYKTMMMVEAPNDSRDTGFLNVTYKAPNRAAEQWVYLPKLHRVSRVANSGKADPLMGSDFSLSDLSFANQDPDSFQLKLIDGAAKVGNEDCWIIETTPRTEAQKREIGYSRIQVWISKSKVAMLQFKGTLLDGKRTKYLKASDLRAVNGIWTPYRMNMRTMDGSAVISETSLDYLSVDNESAAVQDSDFTQQRLEQGV